MNLTPIQQEHLEKELERAFEGNKGLLKTGNYELWVMPLETADDKLAVFKACCEIWFKWFDDRGLDKPVWTGRNSAEPKCLKDTLSRQLLGTADQLIKTGRREGRRELALICFAKILKGWDLIPQFYRTRRIQAISLNYSTILDLLTDERKRSAVEQVNYDIANGVS